MKKTLSLIAVLILTAISSCIYGHPVDPAIAKEAASNFWASVTGTEAVRWMDVTSQTDFQEFYIFEKEDGIGFVIISADDCVQPILGYSTTTRIPSPLPAHIRSFLNRYDQEIAYHRTSNTPATEEIELAWSSLIEGTFSPQTTTSVSPLLTTTWDQSPYYNNLCPDSSGVHAVAGCVATAVAQVMKFWNWPTTGLGSHSYTDDNFGYQSANFGGTTYNWSIMPTALNSLSTSAEVDAVATLIYHVGVAVEMDYGLGGSAALLNSYGYSSIACGENALKNYFRYKGSLHSVYKDQTSDAAWISTLTNELDAGRPVLERGSGDGGGHAFVCDGYDNNGLFHINWGWSSYMDGYFAHNALNPGQGGTGGNDGYTFNEGVAIVVGISPNGLLTCYPQMLTFTQEGGTGTVNITPNNTSSSNWQAVSNQSWLTLSSTSGNSSSGPVDVTVTAAPNNTGNDRTAIITVSQGTQSCTIQVLQSSCNASDQCTVVLEMSDSYGDGWNGAYLTITSSNGFVYGTATCQGASSTQQISVCPAELTLNWTSGSWDTECSFSLYTSGGTLLLSVGDTPMGSYTVSQPCSGTYTITTVSSNSAMGSVTGGGNYYEGDTAMLSATANTGYRFTNWSDGSSENPHYVAVTGNATYTANFADLGDSERHYDNGAYATSIGAGGELYWGIRFPAGTLSPYSTLSAVRIWENYAGTYELQIYEGGTTAPGTLVASQSCQFNGSQYWSDAILSSPITINHSQPLWIVIHNSGVSYPAIASNYAGTPDGSWVSTNGSSWASVFDYGFHNTWMIRAVLSNGDTPVQQYTITAVSSNSAMGSVTGGGVYDAGTEVTLTATAAAHHHFTGWNDGNMTNPRSITVSGDALYIANFALDQHQITVNSANPSMGTTSGSGTYNYGTNVQITATPYANCVFTRWSDGNTNNPRTITVTGTTTYTAEFNSTIGIDDFDFSNVKIYSHGDKIVVNGAEGLSVEIFDAAGRLVTRIERNESAHSVFTVSSSGIYVVRTGDSITKKVTVIR